MTKPRNGATANGTAGRKETVLGAKEKPPTIPVNAEAIPQALRDLPQWVAWWWERGKDKWTKVPYKPGSRRRASHSDPETWGTFAQAIHLYNRGGPSGVGFVFSGNDPFAGVDLDDCRNPESGELEPWAAEAVATLNSYTEVSPSGTGVKVFLCGSLPGGGRKSGNYEMYDRLRYFAMTGMRLDGVPEGCEERQGELTSLYQAVFSEESKRPKERPTANGHSSGDQGANGHSAGHTAPPWGDDSALLVKAMRAKNGPKFAQLWSGDTSSYSSASDADQAFANLLAFWTARDPTWMDRLFRQSGLMRPKWDETHYSDGRTYGQATIDKAIEGCSETYAPRARRGPGKRDRQPTANNGAAPPSPPLPGALGSSEEAELPTSEQVIQMHFVETLVPTYKQDTNIYSSKQGRLVRMSEAAIPTSAIIDKLEHTSDAPTGKNVDRADLVKHFATMFKVAWGNLLLNLPTEMETAEICDPAQEEFRAKVAGALVTIVALAYAYRDEDGADRTEVQRRPLIEWARMFAKEKRWGDVRGHRLWSRLEPAEDGPPAKPPRLRVAIRCELFKQIHNGDLARTSHRHFAQLCKLYGVGTPTHVAGGSERAIELSAEFLADLLATPVEPQAADETTGRAEP